MQGAVGVEGEMTDMGRGSRAASRTVPAAVQTTVSYGPAPDYYMGSRVPTEALTDRAARTARRRQLSAVIGVSSVARCTHTLSRVQAARHGTSTKRLHMEASPHRSSSHVCSHD